MVQDTWNCLTLERRTPDVFYMSIRKRTMDLWKRKIDGIAERGPWCCSNLHPDYFLWSGPPADNDNPHSYFVELLSTLHANMQPVLAPVCPWKCGMFPPAAARPSECFRETIWHGPRFNYEGATTGHAFTPRRGQAATRLDCHRHQKGPFRSRITTSSNSAPSAPSSPAKKSQDQQETGAAICLS